MKYYYGNTTDPGYAVYEKNGMCYPLFAERYGTEGFPFDPNMEEVTDVKTVAALNKYVYPYEAEKKKVYMAGPLFNEGDRYSNQLLSDALRAAGYTTFLPQEIVIDNESTELLKAACLYMDLKAICESDYMVTNCNGIEVDSGTAAEIGLGYGWGKKMIGYKSDVRNYYNDTHRLNNFLGGLLTTLCSSVEEVLETIKKI